MAKTYKRIDEWLAIWMADYLPKYMEGQTQLQRDGVQLAVWLVGLSVGLVALLIADAGSEGAWLGPTATSMAVGLATATVLFGVLHRVAVYFAQGLAHNHVLDFRMDLAMRTADMDFGPRELSEHWDVPEIVSRLKEGFDLDYSFLIEYNVPLEKSRKIYTEIYTQEKKWEQEALDQLVKVVSAFTDLGKEQEAKMTRPRTEQDLESRREHARRIKAYEQASNRTFYLTGIAFILTVAVIAIGVLGRL